MIVVSGTFRVPPENLARFAPHMEAMIEASRGEIGCGHFNYVEQPDDPGRFHVVELWDSAAALNRHFASDHRKRWRSTWPRFGVGGAYVDKHALRANMESVAAVATVETCGTTTVVLNRGVRDVSVHCLAHRVSRKYQALAAAKDAALNPAEWCKRCEAALSPSLRQDDHGRGALHKWAVVLAFFEATGVPDDPGEPPRLPRRRGRPRSE